MDKAQPPIDVLKEDRTMHRRATHTAINTTFETVAKDENFKGARFQWGAETLRRSEHLIKQAMLQDKLKAHTGQLKDGRTVNGMPLPWLATFLRENPNFLGEVYNSYFIGAVGLCKSHDGMPSLGKNNAVDGAKLMAMKNFFGDLDLLHNYKELTEKELEQALVADFDRLMIRLADKAIMEKWDPKS